MKHILRPPPPAFFFPSSWYPNLKQSHVFLFFGEIELQNNPLCLIMKILSPCEVKNCMFSRMENEIIILCCNVISFHIQYLFPSLVFFNFFPIEFQPFDFSMVWYKVIIRYIFHPYVILQSICLIYYSALFSNLSTDTETKRERKLGRESWFFVLLFKN